MPLKRKEALDTHLFVTLLHYSPLRAPAKATNSSTLSSASLSPSISAPWPHSCSHGQSPSTVAQSPVGYVRDWRTETTRSSTPSSDAHRCSSAERGSDCRSASPFPRRFPCAPHMLRPTRTASSTYSLSSRIASERECCLLVLNLVSSTLPCIRQPEPRLRVLDVCGFV